MALIVAYEAAAADSKGARSTSARSPLLTDFRYRYRGQRSSRTAC